VVFVIKWHDEIIHLGHFHPIFCTPKCHISMFNSFPYKIFFEKKDFFWKKENVLECAA
jgi:hypothetical protein